MAYYFISDVHLRLDATAEARRFGAFVDSLQAADTLVVGGDLCDFWFSSREQSATPDQCQGLSALRRFRQRGGELRLIAGNHDENLEGYYRRWFDCGFDPEPLILQCGPYRVQVLHGHLIGPVSGLKSAIAGPLFHAVFSRTPAALANWLGAQRLRFNIRTHEGRSAKFMDAYRQYCRDHVVDGENQIFVFGHVHDVVDERIGAARMVLLGEWEIDGHALRIDQQGAELLTL